MTKYNSMSQSKEGEGGSKQGPMSQIHMSQSAGVPGVGGKSRKFGPMSQIFWGGLFARHP